MSVATTLHHSFTRGFCSAEILAWAGPRDKALELPLVLENKIIPVRNAWGTSAAVK